MLRWTVNNNIYSVNFCGKKILNRLTVSFAYLWKCIFLRHCNCVACTGWCHLSFVYLSSRSVRSLSRICNRFCNIKNKIETHHWIVQFFLLRTHVGTVCALKTRWIYLFLFFSSFPFRTPMGLLSLVFVSLFSSSWITVVNCSIISYISYFIFDIYPWLACFPLFVFTIVYNCSTANDPN